MMSTKWILNKGKKVLAVTLSVLLGLSLSMTFAPLNAHAKGDSIADGEISEPEIPEPEIPEPETPKPTVPITLTYKGESIDPETAYLMSTDTEHKKEKYPLKDVNEGTQILPPDDYFIYIEETNDEGTKQDFVIQDAKLTVTENTPINYTVNYFCIRFIDFDGTTLLSKQYVAENGRLTEPQIPDYPNYYWLGWASESQGQIIELPTEIVQDDTFYGLWSETPPPAHIHKYELKYDENGHWEECISTEGECTETKVNQAAHTFDKGTITKAATETAEGEIVYKCTICPYTKTAVLPKLEHKHHFGTDWKSDNTSHWHECTCGTRSETAPHTAGEWILDKQATISAEGSRHKECTVCKKVLQTETLAKLVPPKITKGANQIYRQGSKNGLTVTASGNPDDLTGVYVANGVVHRSNYTVTAASGSTVLTLHTAYLDSLAPGTHTLKLAYSNGTCAETQFTIQKGDATAVKTGDASNYIPLIILLILSGGVLVVTAVIHKKGYFG